jgi:hypothetical protein
VFFAVNIRFFDRLDLSCVITSTTQKGEYEKEKKVVIFYKNAIFSKKERFLSRQKLQLVNTHWSKREKSVKKQSFEKLAFFES